MKEIIKNLIQGFSMALADSVPGVSGGTVAFVLGFYDKFINSLNTLISRKKDKKSSISFLIKLGIGWVIGMAIASLILSNLFETHIYQVSSLFIGFIIFAIPLIIKEEKQNIEGKYKNLIFTIIGIIIVSAITYFNPQTGSETSIDITNLNFGLAIYVFVAGMIAISAMILPGISGSTLLLIFGLYVPIITGIKETLHLNLAYIPVLFVFGLGILTGIALVIKLVKKALEKYRSQTIYLILGLMVGSIYAIIMGATTLEAPKAPLSFSTFNIIYFIVGGLVIVGMEFAKRKLENNK
ncbi:uncharacterized protein BN716_00687 [Clostridium sp. CAG:571]|jgi:putative membrane protein|nr:uncharacterized protein BN716_00687 [Clostridium sp. CAG:571]